MWPPTKRERFKLDGKYVLTTIMALSAFLLSLWNAYVTSLRQVDQASVVVGPLPSVWKDDDPAKFRVEGDETFIFINSGTRSVAIDEITLQIAQPTKESKELPRDGCETDGSTILSYKVVPFVVKAAEMLPKKFVLKGTNPIDRTERTSPVLADGETAIVFFSEQNLSLAKRYFKMCIVVTITTPESDLVSIVVKEGVDFLDEDTLGSVSIKQKETPPVPLVNRRHVVFPWN